MIDSKHTGLARKIVTLLASILIYGHEVSIVTGVSFLPSPLQRFGRFIFYIGPVFCFCFFVTAVLRLEYEALLVDKFVL